MEREWRLEDDPPSWFDGNDHDVATIRGLAQQVKPSPRRAILQHDGSVSFDSNLFVKLEAIEAAESIAEAMKQTLSDFLETQRKQEEEERAERAKRQPFDFPG
jgi:hypothetical protein